MGDMPHKVEMARGVSYDPMNCPPRLPQRRTQKLVPEGGLNTWWPFNPRSVFISCTRRASRVTDLMGRSEWRGVLRSRTAVIGWRNPWKCNSGQAMVYLLRNLPKIRLSQDHLRAHECHFPFQTDIVPKSYSNRGSEVVATVQKSLPPFSPLNHVRHASSTTTTPSSPTDAWLRWSWASSATAAAARRSSRPQ